MGYLRRAGTLVIDRKGRTRCQTSLCASPRRGAGQLESPRSARRASRRFFLVSSYIRRHRVFRSCRNQSQRSHESTAFRGRKWIQQPAFRLFRRQLGTAQYPAPRVCDGNLIGSSIGRCPAARQQFAREHAPDHFCQGRAVDTGLFDKHCLARAVVLIKCGEH